MSLKLHSSIILTYRCNARCNMCEVWKNPSRPSEEIAPSLMEKLPDMFFTNITGGEPFVRQDIGDFVRILRTKSRRIVINTNGYFTDRIIALCSAYPDVGIRLSIEGLPAANDAIRGIPDGFDRCMRTLLTLREMKLRDIGLNITVQDSNYADLVPLYELAHALGYEFATTTVHNSHYFHKSDNRIEQKREVIAAFEELTGRLLKSRKVKEWFRAYYNAGLVNYIEGKPRPLPCEMGEHGFFVDPWGDVLACNGMQEKLPMGNLVHQDWRDIWNSEQAAAVRNAVHGCARNCWMIGSAAPAIWHHPVKPALWVIGRKLGLGSSRL